MPRIVRLLPGLAVSVFLAQPPAFAQTATGDPALAEIASALTRIAQAMEKQLEGSRLELLIQRVESGHRRVEKIDEQLRQVENHHDGEVHQRTRLEMQLASFDDPAKMEAMGFDPQMAGLQREQLEFELELVNQRLADLGDRVAQLQGERARRQREVEDWQAFIDRELAGLQ